MTIGYTKQRQGQFRRLGRVMYTAGLRMQKALAAYVGEGGAPDQILFLEHNPVFTLGRGAQRADIHAADDFLLKNGVEVHQIDRGGQVTYHGPGQIVVYPICNLRGGRQNVARFVHGLEQAMINTAADFGVAAERLEGFPGIWAQTPRGLEKLGAVGIHLKKWVSTHGIAFNLDPDMSHFQWITPCGIRDKGVCSLRTLLGQACPSWDEATASLASHIAEILAFEPAPVPAPSQSISVTIWRRGAIGIEVLMMLRCPSEGQWWSSVTGMLEPGETPEMAAHREVMEETGLAGVIAPLDLKHSFWVDPALIGEGLGARGEGLHELPVTSYELQEGIKCPLNSEAAIAASELTDTKCLSYKRDQRTLDALDEICSAAGGAGLVAGGGFADSAPMPEPIFNTETCFHMEVPPAAQVALNTAEHSEYRWCAPEEAMELMIWEGSKAALGRLLAIIS